LPRVNTYLEINTV